MANKGCMRKVLCKDEEDVINQLMSTLLELETKAINERGVFHVGVSGGSIVTFLTIGLPKCPQFNFAKWQVFFCDERYVDRNHTDSTFFQYKTHVIKCTSLTDEQFHGINVKLPLAECAKDYEQDIRKSLKSEKPDDIPQFDVLILGMGPDGHTCSLFPNHKLLKEDSVLIAPIDDSPKPPSERITMTYKLINNANNIICAAGGSEKKRLIDKIVIDDAADESIPIGLVKAVNGQFTMFYY